MAVNNKCLDSLEIYRTQVPMGLLLAFGACSKQKVRKDSLVRVRTKCLCVRRRFLRSPIAITPLASLSLTPALSTVSQFTAIIYAKVHSIELLTLVAISTFSSASAVRRRRCSDIAVLCGSSHFFGKRR
jgi:hypothetical protein